MQEYCGGCILRSRFKEKYERIQSYPVSTHRGKITMKNTNWLAMFKVSKFQSPQSSAKKMVY